MGIGGCGCAVWENWLWVWVYSHAWWHGQMSVVMTAKVETWYVLERSVFIRMGWEMGYRWVLGEVILGEPDEWLAVFKKEMVSFSLFHPGHSLLAYLVLLLPLMGSRHEPWWFGRLSRKRWSKIRMPPIVQWWDWLLDQLGHPVHHRFVPLIDGGDFKLWGAGRRNHTSAGPCCSLNHQVVGQG